MRAGDPGQLIRRVGREQPVGRGQVALGLLQRRVMLSHPRSGEQAALEQQILEDFCSLRQCIGLTAGPVEPLPLTLAPSPLPVAWSFSIDGPVCSSKSLALQMSVKMPLSAGRMLCEQYFSELGMLLLGIARQQTHGVSVVWRELVVQALPGREEGLVRLNSQGDSLLMALPLLQDYPTALRAVLPWAEALLIGQEQALSLTARELGWE